MMYAMRIFIMQTYENFFRATLIINVKVIEVWAGRGAWAAVCWGAAAA